MRFTSSLAFAVCLLVVGCQQAEDPTLSQTSSAKMPVLIRAASGALYSADCIKTRGLSGLSTCGVTRGVRGGRAATVIPDATSTANQYQVYSPTNYQEQSFCPYFTGSSSCFGNLGYQTGANGTATFQGSTNQNYSTQGTTCSVCMGGSSYNCQQRSCFWMVPGFTDTTGVQVYNASSGTFTGGAASTTSLMGNWSAADGSGGISFASGSYTRNSYTTGSDTGSYTTDGTNVSLRSNNGSAYSCTASFPSSSQLSLMCYQNGATTSYFYNRVN